MINGGGCIEQGHAGQTWSTSGVVSGVFQSCWLQVTESMVNETSGKRGWLQLLNNQRAGVQFASAMNLFYDSGWVTKPPSALASWSVYLFTCHQVWVICETTREQKKFIRKLKRRLPPISLTSFVELIIQKAGFRTQDRVILLWGGWVLAEFTIVPCVIPQHTAELSI